MSSISETFNNIIDHFHFSQKVITLNFHGHMLSCLFATPHSSCYVPRHLPLFYVDVFQGSFYAIFFLQSFNSYLYVHQTILGYSIGTSNSTYPYLPIPTSSPPLLSSVNDSIISFFACQRVLSLTHHFLTAYPIPVSQLALLILPPNYLHSTPFSLAALHLCKFISC